MADSGVAAAEHFLWIGFQLLQVTVRPMLGTVVLSVTLVYCGQTVGWIKMPLSTEVGLSLG